MKQSKKRFLLLLFFLYIATAIGLLVYSYIPDLLSRTVGTRDDWQFVQSIYYGPGDPQSFLSTLTPQVIGLLLLALPVFIVLLITSFYSFYRLVVYFAGRFKKNIHTDAYKYSMRKVFMLLVISLLIAGVVLYFLLFQQLLPPSVVMLFVYGIFLVLLFVFLTSVLLLFFLLLQWSFRKVTHRSGSNLTRKAIYGFTGASYFVVIFLPVFFVVQLVYGLFGLELTSLSLPALSSTGGGIPTAGIAPNAYNSVGIKMRSSDLGFSTGGAKDINNFRTNIQNNYLPIPTDITYEGLFYDYYFDSGPQQACNELFCPTYTYAVSQDPFSKQPEYYLSVGLNSGMKKQDFQRKKLNLVIVMDISGSMGSPFDTYYYDKSEKSGESPDAKKTKMQIANEAVVGLLDHLRPGDRFGMVLFDDVGYLAKPVGLVEKTNMELLKSHILKIHEQGGTNMEAGLTVGTELLKEFAATSNEDFENRIIFLTDAQPNTGDYSENGLLGITQRNATNAIYTTFIGIGVDFNTELIEGISKTTGANYYAVHSSEDFKHRMDEGFDYMVTPLVFDLALTLQSSDYMIEKIYGSPQADISTNEIMRVNTLFPSDKTDAGVKGGLILLKLRKREGSVGGNITLMASYKDRSGQKYANTASAVMNIQNKDYYQSSGIRKGILLTRYANLLRGWMIDENNRMKNGQQDQYIPDSAGRGIIIPEDRLLTQWERTSNPLVVSPAYKSAFQTFRLYFATEAQDLNDSTLQQELILLDTIISK